MVLETIPNTRSRVRQPIAAAALHFLFVTSILFAVTDVYAQVTLVYGHNPDMHPSVDWSLAQDLEEYLRSQHGIDASIEFSSRLRTRNRWFADYHELLMSTAIGECPVHALSFGTVPNDWLATGLLREIPELMLRRYSPKYHALLLTIKGDHLYRLPNGAWYALTGYSYPLEESVYHLAAPDTILTGLDPKHQIIPSDGNRDIPLRHYGSIDIDEFETDLQRLKSEHNRAPLLAWSNFESSFAPVYSALGIATMGSNLTSSSSVFNAGVAYTPGHASERTAATISDAFRESIKVIARWYQSGLINDDFASLDYSQLLEQAQTGYYQYLSLPYTAAVTSWPLYQEFSKAALWQDHMGIFQLSHGNRVIARSLFSSPFVGAEAYCFTVSDEQLEAMLLIFDYARVPLDRLGRYSPNDWKKLWFEQHTDDGRLSASREPESPSWHFKRYPEVLLGWSQLPNVPGSIESSWWEPSVYLRGTRPPPPRGARTIVGLSDKLFNITSEYVHAWIHGSADIDDEWEVYVNEWTDAGGYLLIESLLRE